MKRFFITLLTFMTFISAWAYDFVVDGVFYNILSSTDKTVEITYGKYKGDFCPSAMSIPESVSHNDITYKVIAIGDSAFYKTYYDPNGDYYLEIPNGITSIGDYAFSQCRGVVSITFPSSVTSIGEKAFYSCRELTSLTIPASVTYIGRGAFGYCYKITSITVSSYNKYFDSRNNCNAIIEKANNKLIVGCNNTKIPDNITSIGDYAFYRCTGFSGNLTIPSGVTSIGDYAFEWCTGLTGNLTIPSGVTSIGNNAFYKCTGFTGSLTIPSSVTSIGNYAFYGCTGLTGNLTIPSIVTSIGNYTFYGCTGLTGNLTIPSGVTSIGDYAFFGCSGLTGSLTIPSSVTSIGSDAFGGCRSLTGNITIPSSVTSIGSNPFSSCNGLKEIIVDSNSKVYDSRDNCNAIIKTSDNSLVSACVNTVIPGSVTSIGSSAFSGHYIKSISIPSSVTSIGDGAFSFCEELTSISIPSSVTSIGNTIFGHCNALTDVYNNATTPQSITSNIFSTDIYTSLKTLHVPAASVNAYKTSNYWKDITNINAMVNCKKSYINTLCFNYYATGTNADFYTFTGIKDGYIYGIKVEDNILEAGVPYLYIPTSDQIELTDLEDGNISSPSNINGMYGNFTDGFTVTGHDYKILTTSGLKYANSTSGNKIKQYGCYFKTSEIPYLDNLSSNAKPIMKITDELTTGIENAVSYNSSVDVYTTNGVKVRTNVSKEEATTGLDAGMYIINGVKTIVK